MRADRDTTDTKRSLANLCSTSEERRRLGKGAREQRGKEQEMSARVGKPVHIPHPRFCRRQTQCQDSSSPSTPLPEVGLDRAWRPCPGAGEAARPWPQPRLVRGATGERVGGGRWPAPAPEASGEWSAANSDKVKARDGVCSDAVAGVWRATVIVPTACPAATMIRIACSTSCPSTIAAPSQRT